MYPKYIFVNLLYAIKSISTRWFVLISVSFLILSFTTENKAPRVFSVIVGIADYQGNGADLKYADNDAILFRDYLMKAMQNETKAGKTTILLNDKATKNAVLTALRTNFSMANENDFIIFYFSGHGKQGSFAPYDYMNNGIMHEDVKRLFLSSKSKYKIIIADACHAGSLIKGSNYGVSDVLKSYNESKIALLMSSRPEQTSIEDRTKKQGLFTYYLTKGLYGQADLNKDTYITVAELFLYTQNATKKESRGSQIPLLSVSGYNTIRLARLRKN